MYIRTHNGKHRLYASEPHAGQKRERKIGEFPVGTRSDSIPDAIVDNITPRNLRELRRLLDDEEEKRRRAAALSLAAAAEETSGLIGMGAVEPAVLATLARSLRQLLAIIDASINESYRSDPKQFRVSAASGLGTSDSTAANGGCDTTADVKSDVAASALADGTSAAPEDNAHGRAADVLPTASDFSVECAGFDRDGLTSQLSCAEPGSIHQDRAEQWGLLRPDAQDFSAPCPTEALDHEGNVDPARAVTESSPQAVLEGHLTAAVVPVELEVLATAPDTEGNSVVNDDWPFPRTAMVAPNDERAPVVESAHACTAGDLGQDSAGSFAGQAGADTCVPHTASEQFNQSAADRDSRAPEAMAESIQPASRIVDDADLSSGAGFEEAVPWR